jgi:hypothetical protein
MQMGEPDTLDLYGIRGVDLGASQQTVMVTLA